MILRLVCLQIVDVEQYAAYRQAMEPILEAYGGRFVLDVVGAATVHPADFEPDRVLLIAFPTREIGAAFFEDAGYREARSRHFEAAVERTSATWLGASPH